MISTVMMAPRHVPDAARLEEECFSSPWSEDSLYGMLADPHSHFLCALGDGDVLLGYAGFCEVCGEASMYNVAVRKKYRRIGVGKALMNAVISMCDELGAYKLTLEVRESNSAAISLYEGLGFCRVGTRRSFYTHPTEDGIVMEKDIGG